MSAYFISNKTAILIANKILEKVKDEYIWCNNEEKRREIEEWFFNPLEGGIVRRVARYKEKCPLI